MTSTTHWYATLFQGLEEPALRWRLEALQDLVFCMYSHELAKTTDKPHVHVALIFSKRKKLQTVKKYLGGEPHMEILKGNLDQVKAYFSKDGPVQTWGDFVEQRPGKRTDIDEVKQMVKDRKPMWEIVQSARSYQSAKMAELLLKYQPASVREPPKVHWYYGPPGSGKTRTAVEEAGDGFFMLTMKWWDGYDGQKKVVIDDVRPEWMTFNQLLHVLDRYPYRCEVKGASRWMEASEIWVTAPRLPKDIYKLVVEDMNQVNRRITEFREFQVLAGEKNAIQEECSSSRQGDKEDLKVGQALC